MDADRSDTSFENENAQLPVGDVDWPREFGYARLPELPESAPRRHGRISRWLGKVVLRMLGWQVVGRYPDVPGLVIAGGPHTSFWDGIVGFVAILALDLDVRVLAKQSLFYGPIGWVMKWLGGIPVNRKAPEGMVGQMVDVFETHDRLVLGASPEGTRKKVERWRTGFYRIAEQAGVPILTVALDFGSKRIVAGPIFEPSGNVEKDFRRMHVFMAQVEPKRPEQFAGPAQI